MVCRALIESRHLSKIGISAQFVHLICSANNAVHIATTFSNERVKVARSGPAFRDSELSVKLG